VRANKIRLGRGRWIAMCGETRTRRIRKSRKTFNKEDRKENERAREERNMA